MPGNPVEMLGELTRRAKKRRARLIILDALYLLLPPGRETLNDPGAMGPIMQALNRLAHETGAAVLLITHDSKGGGDVAGSFVIRAAAKVIMRLTRVGGHLSPRRMLLMDKNKLGQKRTWHLQFEGPGAWKVLGAARSDHEQELRRRVREFLKAGGTGTARQIAKTVSHRIGAVTRVLKRFVEVGRVAAVKVHRNHAGRPSLRYMLAGSKAQKTRLAS
jgi:hypothetical protein